MQAKRVTAHAKTAQTSDLSGALGAYTGALGKGPASVNINRSAQAPVTGNGTGLSSIAPADPLLT
jgi:hypothetical protein